MYMLWIAEPEEFGAMTYIGQVHCKCDFSGVEELCLGCLGNE